MQINIQKLDYKEKYNTIRNHPAFYKLSPEIIQSVIKKLSIQNYCKNQIVYNEQEPLQRIFIVKIGEFKMSKRILQANNVFNYLKKWKQHEICLLEKNDTFGIELMDTEPYDYYKYTVSCQSIIGQLYTLRIDDLQKILTEHYLKIDAKNLFIYQQQISKNKLYQQREAQINQLFSNLTESLQHKEIRSFSQNHSISDNLKFPMNHRSISYDASYCEKVQSLVNYQKQISFNPRRIIKTEILEDDSYINRTVNDHIKALKPFITNFENGRQQNDRQQIQSLERINELNQNEKLFKLKVLYKLGYRPKKKLQIKLHSIQSQRFSQIFPFKIK